MHLLALLIEVTSIGVAGKQLKKPIDINRPGKGKGRGQRQRPDAAAQQPAHQGQTAGMQHAVGVFRSTRRKKG